MCQSGSRHTASLAFLHPCLDRDVTSSVLNSCESPYRIPRTQTGTPRPPQFIQHGMETSARSRQTATRHRHGFWFVPRQLIRRTSQCRWRSSWQRWPTPCHCCSGRKARLIYTVCDRRPYRESEHKKTSYHFTSRHKVLSLRMVSSATRAL